MPNTIPPITSCIQAATYREELLKLESTVEYFMTLYLNEQISLEDVAKNARNSHVIGIKSYPKGVTTNSDAGIQSYKPFYPLFSLMEQLGLFLHIHGELPNVSPLDAEKKFLPEIEKLVQTFPRLKIILEHVTTKEAVEFVKMHEFVGATITAHHLEITMEDVFTKEIFQKQEDIPSTILNPHNYCKPIAKSLEDKAALCEIVQSGHPRFFLGSDSAPHRKCDKESYPAAAGVFTQPLLINYILDSFERLNCMHNLRAFLCSNSASFFGFAAPELQSGENALYIKKAPTIVPVEFKILNEENTIIPFLAGKELGYTVEIMPYKTP